MKINSASSYFFFLLFIIIISPNLCSQNTLLVGSKPYDCTPSWSFGKNESSPFDRITISVAKNGEDGLFYISVNSPDQSQRLVSPCIIYLEDNTVINCLTILSKDFVDGNTSAIFKLTKDEVTKMSVSRIKTVRYNLQVPSGNPKYQNPKEAYTADNSGIYNFNTKKTEFAQTEVDIKNLFGI